MSTISATTFVPAMSSTAPEASTVCSMNATSAPACGAVSGTCTGRRRAVSDVAGLRRSGFWLTLVPCTEMMASASRST